MSDPDDDVEGPAKDPASSAMDPDRSQVSRREMLQMSGGALASFAIGAGIPDGVATEVAPRPASTTTRTVAFVLKVNGRDRRLDLDPRTTLLDALREHLHLTGTKKGCDHGQCGACTVLINSRRINSCLTLAVMHDGDDIVTIEGLGSPGALHPMQAAFVERDGFQCGYCTSGQICSAVAMLAEVRAGWPSHATADVAEQTITLTDEEIRERMSGNICRCAAYPNIVAAIRDVAAGAPG
jgi:xanthine dehydrogenase YagT iron-sulfur-binding subunit